MPKVKVTITLTPDEFRKILPPKLQEIYDRLVNSLIEYGTDEKEAKSIVANELNQAIKDLLSDERCQNAQTVENK